MKKLYYIPAVIFGLSAIMNAVLYYAYIFGIGVVENDGSAALSFIHTITGAMVTGFFISLATD